MEANLLHEGGLMPFILIKRVIFCTGNYIS